jgi:hypothetical protein
LLAGVPVMRVVLIVLSCLALSACGLGVQFGGPPLISGKSPAAAMAASSEPEPVNSFPPGVEGIGGGPNARAPNTASATIGTVR